MKAFSFKGSAIEYFKIWIVNVVLTLLTLGLYYPWAKVRNRRYFYANTTLEDRNFEYHATGKRLFFSYLIAMALLILYVIIQKLSPAGSFVMIMLLFIAIPWLILKSMTFNTRMTSFSNVRFDFVGETPQAYINFFVYPIALYLGLVLFSVFIVLLEKFAVPMKDFVVLLLSISAVYFIIYMLSFMKKKNSEFYINNARYGQGVFKSSLELNKLMIIRLKTIGISVVSFIASLVIVGLFAYGFVGLEAINAMNANVQDPQTQTAKAMLPLIGSVYIMMLLAFMFVVAYSFVKHREYIYANSVLDDKISFKSTLSVSSYAWVLLSNFLLIIVTLGLGFAWAKVRIARVIAENTLVEAEDGFDLYFTQKEEEVSSLGEQIGDAFDVNVGVGF